MKTGVLIPAYNAAPTIGELVRRVVGDGYPVIVVDDGSTDGTGALAQAAGARLIRHAHNEGKGASLRDAFRTALDEPFDAVIVMDADGQHDVTDLGRFIARARASSAGLIIGNRMEHPCGMPRVRRWTNRLMSWLASS